MNQTNKAKRRVTELEKQSQFDAEKYVEKTGGLIKTNPPVEKNYLAGVVVVATVFCVAFATGLDLLSARLRRAIFFLFSFLTML